MMNTLLIWRFRTAQEEVVNKTRSFEKMKSEAEKCLTQGERLCNEKWSLRMQLIQRHVYCYPGLPFLIASFLGQTSLCLLIVVYVFLFCRCSSFLC